MKSVLNLIVVASFLPLAACSIGDGATTATLANGNPSAKTESFDSSGFSQEKVLTAQEYTDLTAAFAKAKSCGTDSDSFKAYKVGDDFIEENHVVLSKDGEQHKIDYRLSSTVKRIKDQEMNFLETFEKYTISGFNGETVNADDNRMMSTCTKKENKVDGVVTCESGLKLTDEAQKYLTSIGLQEDPKEECSDVYADPAKDVVSYAKGSFRLKTDKRVAAILIKKERKLTRKCKSGDEDFSEVSESIVTDKLKTSSGNECSMPAVTVFAHSLRKSADKNNAAKSIESTYQVKLAPGR